MNRLKRPAALVLVLAAAAAIRPPANPDPAEWAETNLRLDPTLDAAPRFLLSKSPYAAPVLRWWTDPDTEEIFLLWPTQSGKTTCMIALLGYVISNDPGGVMFVTAQDETTKAFLQMRLKPAMKATFPKLVNDSTRNRDWTEGTGAFVGGTHIWPAWATSEARCRSWPRRYIFGDETSIWKLDRQFMLERTKQFSRNRKILWGTTPTVVDEPSWVDATEIFQLHRWSVPCPRCGVFQVLEFKNLKFDHCRKVDQSWDFPKVEAEAYYPCESCGAELREKDKAWMLQNGEALCLTPERSAKRRSMRVTCMDVPCIPWGESARKFLESKNTPSNLKTVVNGWLTEPWTEVRTGLSARAVLARVMAFDGEIPADCISLGAGIDVQHGHIYAVLRAWCADGRSVLIWCGHIDERHDKPLKTEFERQEATFRALERFHAEIFTHAWLWEKHPERIRASFAAVDSGDGRTQKAVYGYAGRHFGSVFPVKGQDGGGVGVVRKDVENNPPLPGLWFVSTNFYRDYITAAYAKRQDEAGAWLVGRSTPAEYGQHIESWQAVDVEVKDKNKQVKSVKREWRRTGREDHYLDAEIYAQALRDALNYSYVKTNPDGVIPPKPRVVAAANTRPIHRRY